MPLLMFVASGPETVVVDITPLEINVNLSFNVMNRRIVLTTPISGVSLDEQFLATDARVVDTGFVSQSLNESFLQGSTSVETPFVSMNND